MTGDEEENRVQNFGWRRGEHFGKGGMGSGVRVTKGDDVNEIEVWKQGFISVLEHQTQHRGNRERRGENAWTQHEWLWLIR